MQLWENFNMSGWPSGLRRQTQEKSSCEYAGTECSGHRMMALVRIPLLTTLLSF